MPKFHLPRAFRAFDVARHVSRVPLSDAPVVLTAVGLDIGIDAPCVAVHGNLHEDRHLHIHSAISASQLGLDLFVAGGYVGDPSTVQLVAAERAVDARSPISGTSARKCLEDYGFRVLSCRMPPVWRIDSIAARLEQPGPVGSISVTPECLEVIGALIGHRCIRTEQRTVATDTPGWLHVVDALGYLVEAAARWAAAETVVGKGVLIDIDG